MKSKMKRQTAVLIICALFAGILPVGNPAAGKAVTASAAAGTTAQVGYGLNDPVIDSSRTTRWNCVWFGNYWQEDTNGDGKADQNDAKQPVKWRVLSVDGDDAFLLADKGLDCVRYNATGSEVTWETCTVRSWLNGYGAEANGEGINYGDSAFIHNVFSETERSAVRTTDVVNNNNPEYGTKGENGTSDQVYLLSLDEVTNKAYGSLSGGGSEWAEITRYAEAQGAGRRWWLRSSGSGCYAPVVGYYGDVGSIGYGYDDVAVRPALHLDLSFTSSWSYAGTVNSSGGQDEVLPTLTATPTPKVTTNTPSAKKETSSVGKVSSLKLKQKNHTVTISWKRVSKATDYQICYSTSKKWKNKKLKLTKKNKLTIKKLKKKKTYYFRVRAYQTKGKSKTYGPWSAVKKIAMKK